MLWWWWRLRNVHTPASSTDDEEERRRGRPSAEEVRIHARFISVWTSVWLLTDCFCCSKSVRMTTKKFEVNTVRNCFIHHSRSDQKQSVVWWHHCNNLGSWIFGSGAKWGSRKVKFPEKVSLNFVWNTDTSVKVLKNVNIEAYFAPSSRQRISSRSIQEKMERLAQAAQVSKAAWLSHWHSSVANFDLTLCLEKNEVTRYPDVTQRTLLLYDEVSRKREIFEKEQQAGSTSKQVPLSQTAVLPCTIMHLLNPSMMLFFFSLGISGLLVWSITPDQPLAQQEQTARVLNNRCCKHVHFTTRPLESSNALS